MDRMATAGCGPNALTIKDMASFTATVAQTNTLAPSHTVLLTFCIMEMIPASWKYATNVIILNAATRIISLRPPTVKTWRTWRSKAGGALQRQPPKESNMAGLN